MNFFLTNNCKIIIKKNPMWGIGILIMLILKVLFHQLSATFISILKTVIHCIGRSAIDFTNQLPSIEYKPKFINFSLIVDVAISQVFWYSEGNTGTSTFIFINFVKLKTERQQMTFLCQLIFQRLKSQVMSAG